MAGLYLRTLTRGRKSWLVALLLLIGLSVAAITVYRPRRADYDLVENYRQLVSQLLLGFLVQFVCLFYGLAVVREEVEQRTITYLFLRPLRRSTIILGRYLAALCVTLLINLGVSLLLHGIAGVGLQGLPPLPGVLLAAGLGALFYTSVFTAFATFLPRPTIFGVCFIVFWEFSLPFVPNTAAAFSLRFHLLNLAGVPAPPAFDFLEPLQVSTGTSLAVLLGASLLLMGLALWRFPRREFIMKTAD